MYFIAVGETLINVDHIVCVTKHRDGNHYIELDNDEEIKVPDLKSLRLKLGVSSL